MDQLAVQSSGNFSGALQNRSPVDEISFLSDEAIDGGVRDWLR